MAARHQVKKSVVKKALAAAKELEKIPDPDKKEIVSVYKAGLEEAQRLQKLLKPEWFVKDIDKPATARAADRRKKKK